MRQDLSIPICPNCTASEFVETPQGLFECQYCGTFFQVCPSCRHANNLDAEVCTYCEEPLTIISQVITRHEGTQANPRWLRQTRLKAASIKTLEESASLERMNAILEIEHRREEALEREYEAQKAKDRRILIAIAILAALFVGFILATLIWNLYF